MRHARLFVAAVPPAAVLDQIAELTRPEIEGLRWTTRDQWHATLRFLGRVSDVKVKETPKGNMTFATLEATFTDASGAVVVTERLTFIERP